MFALASFYLFLFLPVLTMGGSVIRVGDIVSLDKGIRVEQKVLMEELSHYPIILVGETHDDWGHHAVQEQIITEMIQRGGDWAVGMEMFPHSLQPVLDLWSQGKLTEDDFLDATDWYFTWGFAADLYLPILRLVRDHHIPLLALNTSASLVRQVRTRGLEGLDKRVKQQLPFIAPPMSDYRVRLQEVFDSHPMMARTGKINDFIDAQCLWDAVMAQTIVDWLGRHPHGHMIALTGSGHLLMKHGIPHQLEARGWQSRTLTVLPWNVGEGDVPLQAADYVWGTPPPVAPPSMPRLGVTLEPFASGKGVVITEVTPNSPADKVGLQIGDRPLSLDDRPLPKPHTLVRLLRDRHRNPKPTLTFLRGDLRMSVEIDLNVDPKEAHL